MVSNYACFLVCLLSKVMTSVDELREVLADSHDSIIATCLLYVDCLCVVYRCVTTIPARGIAL